MSSIIYKRALSEEELQGAYRVRFQTLTLQNGDTRYADFEKKIYKDFTDEGNTRVYIAVSHTGGGVLGTVRLTLREEYGRPFTAEDFYNFPQLANDVGSTWRELLHKVALIERGGVLLEYQNKEVWKQLVRFALEDIKNSEAKIIVGAIEVTNEVGLHAFEIAGWTIVKKEKEYKEKKYYLIYLNLT